MAHDQSLVGLLHAMKLVVRMAVLDVLSFQVKPSPNGSLTRCMTCLKLHQTLSASTLTSYVLLLMA